MFSLINAALLGIIILLIVAVWFFYKIGHKKGEYEREIFWQENLVKIRKDIADKQRSGIKGKLNEVFAPFIGNFPFKASECKFIGDPIDYIVFEGLDQRDIKKIHFLEVKTNKSKMSKHQKQIKELIDNSGNDKINFKEINLKFNNESFEEF